MSEEAASEVQGFLSEEHALEEYKEKIRVFRELAREVAAMDDVVLFDMFLLECHDIKHGLVSKAGELCSAVVSHLVAKHFQENNRYAACLKWAWPAVSCPSPSHCRICVAYEQFKSRALKVPDDSREMIDQIAFMEAARSGLVHELWADVQVS